MLGRILVLEEQLHGKEDLRLATTLNNIGTAVSLPFPVLCWTCLCLKCRGVAALAFM